MPAKLFAKGPRTYGRVLRETAPFRPPVLTKEQLKLAITHICFKLLVAVERIEEAYHPHILEQPDHPHIFIDSHPYISIL